MIHSFHFYDLLDCLAGQFFDTDSARCVGKDFGINISVNAKDYFSVAIIPERLPNNLAVLGVLFDNSAHIQRENGFTFTIYIDLHNYGKEAKKILALIIIAHEICHFAFFYELFLKMGDSTDIRTHTNFTHAVSSKLIGAVTHEQDDTSQNLFDEHDTVTLVKDFRKFTKKHFSKGRETKIDYQKILDGLLKHIHFSEMTTDYLRQQTHD